MKFFSKSSCTSSSSKTRLTFRLDYSRDVPLDVAKQELYIGELNARDTRDLMITNNSKQQRVSQIVMNVGFLLAYM